MCIARKLQQQLDTIAQAFEKRSEVEALRVVVANGTLVGPVSKVVEVRLTPLWLVFPRPLLENEDNLRYIVCKLYRNQEY